MNSFKIVKNSLSRVKHCWSDYFISMVMFQFIRMIIVLPSLAYLFSKVLKRTGVLGLTDQNMLIILSKPINLLLLLLILILSVLFIFYELGYYFLLADKQISGEEYSFKGIIKELYKKGRYFISIYILLFIVYFLLFLPLISVGLSSTLTSSLKIPDFIIDELLLTTRGQVIYALALGVLTYIVFRLIYTIYFFVTERNLGILDALKKSWNFSKRKTLKNIFTIFLVTVIPVLMLLIVVSILLLPVIVSDMFTPKISPVIAGIFITVIQLISMFVGALIQPLIVNVIIETTGKKENEIVGEATKPLNLITIIKSNKYIKFVAVIVFILFVGVNTYATVNVIYQPQSLVIAHRGNTEKGVENSLGSLNGAADVDADAVEMDIQETKDGKFVVMHDFNLKRLAGVNKNPSDMTLEELTKLGIKQNGFKDRIPSLDEYIDTAKKRNIKLLIEVKPHGKESKEMEENLVKLLKEKRVDEYFMVQSLDLNVMDKIKEIAPEIQTGYIVPLNIGKLPQTKHDFLVLEDFSISKSKLNSAREENIKMFAWTINEEDLMKKYFRLDIDAIITNHPETAVKIRDDEDNVKTILDRVNYILEK